MLIMLTVAVAGVAERVVLPSGPGIASQTPSRTPAHSGARGARLWSSHGPWRCSLASEARARAGPGEPAWPPDPLEGEPAWPPP